MADEIIREEGERLLIRLDTGGPIELSGLTDSFGALARIYERHYRPHGETDPPRLFVTRLSTGSILAEIANYAIIFGGVMTLPAAAVTLGDFAKRLNDGLRAFARITVAPSAAILPMPDNDDARDLRAFISPLTGREGAGLGLTLARFHSVSADREVIAEYEFDENAINRAALNMDRTLGADGVARTPSTKAYSEVMLFFESASRSIGKEGGRTKDTAIVPEITKKALPTYFRHSIDGNLKDVMVRGSQNPLANVAYVVDLHVQLIDGEPRGYIVTNVHRTIEQGDDAKEEDASPSA